MFGCAGGMYVLFSRDRGVVEVVLTKELMRMLERSPALALWLLPRLTILDFLTRFTSNRQMNGMLRRDRPYLAERGMDALLTRRTFK